MFGMQLQLFDNLPLPPRPGYYSNEVTLDLVDSVLPHISKWICDDGTPLSDLELEDIRDDLSSIVDFEDDPYKILKGLEHLGYDGADRRLYDIMSNVADIRWSIWKQHVNSWVLRNGVITKFSVGDVVDFRHNGEMKTGRIKAIYENTAEYSINAPMDKGRFPVVPFESCTLANTVI
jgi:hypothetical protein